MLGQDDVRAAARAVLGSDLLVVVTWSARDRVEARGSGDVDRRVVDSEPDEFPTRIFHRHEVERGNPRDEVPDRVIHRPEGALAAVEMRHPDAEMERDEGGRQLLPAITEYEEPIGLQRLDDR